MPPGQQVPVGPVMGTHLPAPREVNQNTDHQATPNLRPISTLLQFVVTVLKKQVQIPAIQTVKLPQGGDLGRQPLSPPALLDALHFSSPVGIHDMEANYLPSSCQKVECNHALFAVG